MYNQEKIRKARECLRDGLPIPEDVVRPLILSSWLRCRKNGVPMEGVDKTPLSDTALRQRILARPVLCNIAFSYLEELYTHIQGSGFLLSLSDEEGYILFMRGDEKLKKYSEDNLFVAGANRSEERFGTNGIGTVLTTGQPLQVYGNEHYFEVHSDWACSGAPIILSGGKIGGVVCLSGMAENVSAHTVGLVAAAADSISRQIHLKELLDQKSLLTEKLDLIIETFPNSVALLDQDLRITTFNHCLTDLLQIPAEQLQKRPVFDLIDKKAISESAFRNGIQDKALQLTDEFHHQFVSLSVQKANPLEYVMQLMPLSELHQRVNHILGNDAHFSFQDIIGESPQIRDTIKLAQIAATNDATVLLQGESGTGKELFAQSIHNASARRNNPFIAVNCGAIPKSLIESELFGYESGSFTGARKEGAAGKFELADGGTIFLDEIDGMSFETQVALLRVLQNREVQRIGARKPKRINVRIISASNQNLEHLVSDHKFRQDLYFRLNVFNIKIPSLRERGEDIRILSEFFLVKYAANTGSGRVATLSEDALFLLLRYPWEGNVRQLENALERAVYITPDGWITPACLPREIQEYVPAQDTSEYSGFGVGNIFTQTTPAGRQSAPAAPDGISDNVSQPKDGKPFSIQERENHQIQEALSFTHGNIREAAGLLGISRRTLYRKLELYHIDYNQSRG